MRRFGAQGFRKTTLDEIAGDVGLVKSALYKYFRSKDDLFDAMLDEIASQHMAAAEQVVLSGGDCAARIRGLLTALFDLIFGSLREHGVTLENWNEMRPLFAARTARHRQGFSDFVRRIVADGVARGEVRPELDPALLATLVRLSFDNIFEQVLMKTIAEEDCHRYIDVIVSVVMDGIRLREAVPVAAAPIGRLAGRGRS